MGITRSNANMISQQHAKLFTITIVGGGDDDKTVAPRGWWISAATGVSLLWSTTATIAAYHFWSTRESNKTQSKLLASNEHDVLETSSWWNRERWLNTLRSLWGKRDLLLARGVDCYALVLKTFNCDDDKATEDYLIWGSGLLTLVVWAINQRDQVPNTSSHQARATRDFDGNWPHQNQRQSRNSTYWILLYFILFPVPESNLRKNHGLGRWLGSCLYSTIRATCSFGNQYSNNDNSKTDDGLESSKHADNAEYQETTNRDTTTTKTVEDISESKEGEEQPIKFDLPPLHSRKKPLPVRLQSLDIALKNLLPLEMAESAQSSVATPPNNRSKRYLEILLHNVSHTDLVLSLKAPDSPLSSSHYCQGNSGRRNPEMPDLCLCRPRFSFFDHYCRSIMENINGNETIVSFPRYHRSADDPRFSILREPSNGIPIPTGLCLASNPKVMADLSEVRMRGRDHAKVLSNNEPPCHEIDNGTANHVPVSHIFFPLLATLLPRWESQILQKYPQPGVKRVLILVTGVGTPRNWTHSVNGNSTKVCADLMEHFVRRLDPDIVVVKIHSETNIFRYDENLVFVQQELMPVINAFRDAHASGLPYPDEGEPKSPGVGGHSFDVDWRRSLSVTLSFADGSPARTYAIQAGLRHFRPTFFHFWQLKTFWHESKIVDDDIEVYAFEAMDTSPAIDVQSITDPHLHMVVEDMIRFKDEMIQSLKNADNDIKNFWLRKSQKPVLAVLLVKNPDDGISLLYRGTNMEVSMPTGSLCAERNVIGTALAANPNLKREHLKMIAVLSVPTFLDDDTTSNIPSTSASTAAVAGSTDDAGIFLPITRDNSTTSLGGSTFAGSFTDITIAGGGRKISLGSENDEWTGTGGGGTSLSSLQPHQSNVEIAFTVGGGARKDSIPHGFHASLPKNPLFSTKDEGSTPVCRIALYSSSHSSSKPGPSVTTVSESAKTQAHKKAYKRRRLVVVQSNRDLNPLDPCGACNEWLKKIAECNPYFQVVTFTDANCNGVYCRSVQP